MSLFGNLATSTTKPTLTLGGNSTTNNTGGTSLFGKPFGASTTTTSSTTQPAQQQQQSSTFNLNTSTNTAAASVTNGPQIDVAHLRNTTKFDHLQPPLQQDLLALDEKLIQQQITFAQEVSSLLPNIAAQASQLAPAIDYVSVKLDELENGLENDAEQIVGVRDGETKRDEGEAKCVFRAVDRLKMPRGLLMRGIEGEVPAQAGTSTNGSNGGGLSGWWNQPYRTGRSVYSGGDQSMSLVNDDADDGSGGPKNLVDLFQSRTDGFRSVTERHKALLGEIEDFVDGLEDKVMARERELNERLNFGNDEAVQAERKAEEREREMQQLLYVFGEVQRGLYEMADKVGTTRDGVVELGMLR